VEYGERLHALSQQFSRKLTVRPAQNDPKRLFVQNKPQACLTAKAVS